MSNERLSSKVPHVEPPKKSHLALGVMILSIGAFLLAFPKYIPFEGFLAGLCYFVGAILTVIGIIGTCLELFPQERER